MTTCLQHRGPDDHGYYVNGKMALGHRRLSIIDLKTGRQPMFNEDRTKCIVYNGEVFNFKEINKELIKKGHRFSTSSDTETVLHAYEEWGEDCLHKFRGMFAFCIWDSINETLFLARDRLGIKPLVYAEYDGKFVFASEMKSILLDPRFDRSMDEEALVSYFIFSYIPAPLTIYKNIRKLLPGHYLILKNGQVQIKKYWDLYFEPNYGRKENEIVDDFMGMLQESVGIRLVSDVPIGAFLSGGIDSSTVVAMMCNASDQPVNSFTIGFGGNTGGFDDERKYARMLAKEYNTAHKEYEVIPSFDGLMEILVESFDEPFADDSAVPTYFVSRMTRKDVTVALSGLGGDENFGGYERYLGFSISHGYGRMPVLLKEKVINAVLKNVRESASGGYTINHIKRFLRSSSADPGERYLGYVTKINGSHKHALFSKDNLRISEIIQIVERKFLNIYHTANATNPLDRVFYCDIKTYLPDDILTCTDRMSMRNSLEVRVPFLDHKFMEYCATIPPELKIKWLRKKYILKKGVAGLLPGPILHHKKQGFVGPMAKWLQTDLKKYTLDILSGKNMRYHNLLNHKTVENILSEHYNGKETHDTTIWSLLIFQTWFNLYMK